jgi:hypothetical protein
MAKERMLSMRVPDKLMEDYKKMCDDNSWIMSRRLRKLMETDLIRWAKYKSELEKEREKKD